MKDANRKKLEADLAKFLAQGHQVKQVPSGYTESDFLKQPPSIGNRKQKRNDFNKDRMS